MARILGSRLTPGNSHLLLCGSLRFPFPFAPIYIISAIPPPKTTIGPYEGATARATIRFAKGILFMTLERLVRCFGADVSVQSALSHLWTPFETAAQSPGSALSHSLCAAGSCRSCEQYWPFRSGRTCARPWWRSSYVCCRPCRCCSSPSPLSPPFHPSPPSPLGLGHRFLLDASTFGAIRSGLRLVRGKGVV